eukprot:Opistho-2@63303
MDSHDVDCSKANRMHNSAALCSSTATADRNAVEAVLCKGHRRPCLIKTGVRDGPSKGKSYYVCSIRDGSCSHVSTATLAGTSHVTVCAVHGQPISLRSQSTTESPAVQYRCASNERTQWCESYSVMTLLTRRTRPRRTIHPLAHRGRAMFPKPREVKMRVRKQVLFSQMRRMGVRGWAHISQHHHMSAVRVCMSLDGQSRTHTPLCRSVEESTMVARGRCRLHPPNRAHTTTLTAKRTSLWGLKIASACACSVKRTQRQRLKRSPLRSKLTRSIALSLPPEHSVPQGRTGLCRHTRTHTPMRTWVEIPAVWECVQVRHPL